MRIVLWLWDRWYRIKFQFLPSKNFVVNYNCLLIAALIFSAGYYSAPIFYNSKNLNCIGALSFYDSKRIIGEVLFFNQFFWSDFWSGKWNAWKIWSDFGAEQTWRTERKESGFLFIPLFLREREYYVWKNFL